MDEKLVLSQHSLDATNLQRQTKRFQSKYLHNGIDSPAVPFPHASETRLATNIPNLKTAYVKRSVALLWWTSLFLQYTPCWQTHQTPCWLLTAERCKELVISWRWNCSTLDVISFFNPIWTLQIHNNNYSCSPTTSNVKLSVSSWHSSWNTGLLES